MGHKNLFTGFACDGSRSLAIAVAAGCFWATCPPALYRRAAAHCGKQTNGPNRIRTISAFMSVIAASMPSEHEGRESSHRYEQMARLPILNRTSNVYSKRRSPKQQESLRLQKQTLCSSASQARTGQRRHVRGIHPAPCPQDPKCLYGAKYRVSIRGSSIMFRSVFPI